MKGTTLLSECSVALAPTRKERRRPWNNRASLGERRAVRYPGLTFRDGRLDTEVRSATGLDAVVVSAAVTACVAAPLDLLKRLDGSAPVSPGSFRRPPSATKGFGGSFHAARTP